jgi:hypothetical protein
MPKLTTVTLKTTACVMAFGIAACASTPDSGGSSSSNASSSSAAAPTTPLKRDASALPELKAEFAQFKPQPTGNRSRIEYTIWDEALRSFVFFMGSSLRTRSSSVEPNAGTRIVYGHDSPYRLEGNRVRFSYFNDDVIDALSDYRKDLETVPSQINFTGLSRNEQLAYWMNLHNVSIIEQIARDYPISQPSRIELEINGTKYKLDDAPFINVAGVAMSPKDIRTQIIYPNWSDPKVIYGLFRGDIGGPSIQGDAFNRSNLNRLLKRSGREFVNSLRGVQNSRRGIRISDIYAEARPYYFQNWPNDIEQHLRQYAKEDVLKLLNEKDEIFTDLYEYDIADLAKGEIDPSYSNLVTVDESGGTPRDFGPSPSVARLLNEFRQKIEIQRQRNGSRGTVTIIDIPTDADQEEID